MGEMQRRAAGGGGGRGRFSSDSAALSLVSFSCRVYLFWIWTAVIIDCVSPSQGIEMHFEPKDGGFFIRPAILPSMTSSSSSSSSTSSSTSDEMDLKELDGFADPSTVTTEHFTVLPNSQPVSIRVMYGPFSTKQSVPIRLLVPDPLETPGGSNGTGGSSDPEMIPPLDLSAHIVTPTVPKDSPILRVLFHAGQTAFGLPIPQQGNSRGNRQQNSGGSRRHRTRLCLVAQATKSQGDMVSASCSPDARDSTCLAELTLPIHWWPEGSQLKAVSASSSTGSHHHGLATGNINIGSLPMGDGETQFTTHSNLNILNTNPNTNTNSNNNHNIYNSGTPLKPTKIPIQVSYAVYEPENGHCNEIGLSTTYGAGVPGEGSSTKRIQIQPPTPLATVHLLAAQRSYRVIKADASDAVKILVPQGSIYPHTKFYMPVMVGKHDHQSIVAFIMRARVKSGLRIIGIEPSTDKMWNITTDFNPRRSHATITAVRKFDPRFQEPKSSEAEEVFNWILEASEEAGDDLDRGRVVWILRYVIQPSADPSWMKKDPFSNFGDERHKLTTRLEIQKDDIQAVLPIAKSWEVVNSAVLNGKQVSRPMKIFIVSRAGTVADVTLQASCRSLDESVLKVSSSCTSVYVDGSEIRGSTNATIIIKYGTYEGNAEFTVWMPEFPLDIQLSDSRLNQIKGWRVPNGLRESQGKRDVSAFTKVIDVQNDYPSKDQGQQQATRGTPTTTNSLMMMTNAYFGGVGGAPTGAAVSDGAGEKLVDEAWKNGHDDINGHHDHEEDSGHDDHDGDVDDDDDHDHLEETDLEDAEVEDKFHCRPRYQHSRIDVYARFMAQDHDSGRTSYFISRKTYLKVTDLISDYLRVSDTQVAVIKGASSPAVQGTGSGRTEVQVVSPVTGRVLGTREVRVVNEKVSLLAMKVQVISGVQLSLFPDTDSDNEFVAETAITSKLSAKYQEALLDISLRFSDGSWVKLDEIERENYVLAVGSLEPTVVELPPIQNSKYPRIIAVSEGSGPIMRVSLELSDQCHRQNSVPLAMSVAQVEVNFTTSTSRSEFTQNDSNLGSSMNTKHSFRKTGRGNKERNGGGGGSGKKDLSAMSSVFRGGSGGNTLHHSHHSDIAGILLKDDSSKASMPSQHLGPISVGFLPDKGWSFAAHNTPLEIAMYVLLGVFSVAILVFVASCFVYASRVKKRETGHPEDFALGMKMEQNPMLGRFAGVNGSVPAGGCTTNAHDWVWLGRASLALHPSMESNRNTVNSRGGKPGFEQGAGRQIANTPIRIIANPSFESQQQQQLAQSASSQLSLTSPLSQITSHPLQQSQISLAQQPGNSRQFGRSPVGAQSQEIPTGFPATPPPRPPKTTAVAVSSTPIDTTTFSVKQQGGNIVVGTGNGSISSSKAGSPPCGFGATATSTCSSTNSTPGVMEAPDYRPPIPPHRNISTTGHHNDSSSSSSKKMGGASSSNPSNFSSSPPSSTSQLPASSPNSYNLNNFRSSKAAASAKSGGSSNNNRSNHKDGLDVLPSPSMIEFPETSHQKKVSPLTSHPSSSPPSAVVGAAGSNTSSTPSISPSSSSHSSRRDRDQPYHPPLDLKRPANIVGNPMCYIDEECEDDEDNDDDDLERPLTVAVAAAAAARQNHQKYSRNHHNGGDVNHGASGGGSASSTSSSSRHRTSSNNSNHKLDMDYDQLMEYFDSLKETEA